ncbi:MAG: MFS transporter [Halobacteriaceae archaeon]
MSRLQSRHAVLAAGVAAYFGIRFVQVLIGPLVPAIVDELGTSRGVVGLALTGMWVAYALVQLPSGVAAARHGGRRVALFACGATAAAGLFVAASPGVAAFALAVVALGAGAGLYYNSATALLAAAFDDLGSAIGLHRLGAQAAGLCAPLVVAAVSLRYGWRVAVLPGVGAAGLGAVAVLVGTRPVTPARRGESLATVPDAVRELLAQRAVVGATALASVGEFANVATQAFLPALLVARFGLSVGAAGAAFAGYFALVGVSQPTTGWLSDRVGRDETLAATFLAAAVGYAALAAGETLPAAGLGVACVAAGMGWPPALQSRVVEGLDADDRDRGFGLVRTGYILLGAFGTAVVGGVSDLAGWSLAFGTLAVLSAAGALGCLFARRDRRQRRP